MDFFVNNIYTVILFPLWIFLLIVLGRFFNVVQSRRIISLITLISTLYGIVFAIGCFLYMQKTPDFVFENSYSFLKIADYSLDFGVFVDNLSVIMLMVVTTISFVVQLYSSSYMWKDKSFSKILWIFEFVQFFNAWTYFKPKSFPKTMFFGNLLGFQVIC